ncbi:hypothetical protein J0A67_09900 [Algoriphagus aestuariicola]|uniref:Tetratricopeptide repeat protein n=1 Tax=Algoriphagus aestuariicola TaxID=1852016 RepID=A0ABS3BPF2_9BACT|nr:hypothetical protein [Algoriphagus aestuariicola]MBN7801175.1 hypothetical protein [Algoriphagus aestuariicola]
MPAQKIDISIEENFKYCYVLIRSLFAKYFPDGYLSKRGIGAILETFLEGRTEVSIQKFADWIAAKSLEQSNSQAESVGSSTVKDLVNRLSGQVIDNSSKEDPNNFYELKFDAMCQLIGHTSWKDFTLNSNVKAESKKIPKSQLDKINAITSSKKTKILISISTHDYKNGDPNQLKSQIEDEFRWRLAQIKPRDQFILEFDEIEEGITDESEAKERALKKNADLIIWGHFSNEHSRLLAVMNYLVTRVKLNKRIARSSHGYDRMPLEMIDLRFGKVYQKIEYLIFLILAISALIEDEIEVADNYLTKIPFEERCDETYFVLGNCRYLAGEYSEGLELWQEAAERNQKHLRAKINLTRHDLSIRLRKGESLKGKTLKEAKERLADYDPQDASIEESALIGVLFAELGEKEMAIKALEAALKGKKKLEEGSYYHIRLGQLKNDPREYAKAALATEHFAIHKLCIRLITNSGLSEEEKVKLRAKVHENVKSNPELRRLYSENAGSIKEDNLTKTTDFTVYDISGLLRKLKTEDLLKNGDGLNFDDWVFADNKAAKAVLLKWDRNGGDLALRRLYLPKPNVPTKIEESIYEYAESLRSSNSDDKILLLCLRELKLNKRVESKKVGLVCQEIGLKLSLVYDNVGRLMLDRRMFDPFSEQMAGKHTTIEIQQDTGDFTTIQKLRILIPDDDEVMDRVDKFSELIDYSDDKYYAKLATYLSDFYAPADETDVELWSVAQHLNRMELL